MEGKHQLRSETGNAGLKEMELQDFVESPRFPLRRTISTSSTDIDSLEASSHSSTPKSSFKSGNELLPKSTGSKSKQRLLFTPLDLLNLTRKPNESSSFSPIHKSGASLNETLPEKLLKSPKFPKRVQSSIGNLDSHIEKADKFFDVAPKDISVLERIGHRAQPSRARIRNPHEVFVELEEIRMDPSEELEWAETARWIKFEEDVEEGSGRWGRPHISALAFHSLVELQRGLDKGCVLLDVNGEDFPSIVDQILDSLVMSNLLLMKSVDQLRTLLLKKHKHTNDSTLWDKLKHSATDGTLHHIGEGLRRISSHDNHLSTTGGSNHDNNSGPVNLERKGTISIMPLLEEVDDSVAQSLSPTEITDGMTYPTDSQPSLVHSRDLESLSSSKKVTFSVNTPHSSHSPSHSSGYITTNSDSTHVDSTLSKEQSMEKNHPDFPVAPPILKHHVSSVREKLNPEAESLTVLVGGVNFLEQHITAFVRLGQSLMLGDLTEVDIPVRFIFLQIGPDDSSLDYHEVGRAMATLMSDTCFHEIAYSAICKEDLIQGMDEFLDDSIVLPPGDWGEDLLLPAMQERNVARRRKASHVVAVESYQKMVVNPLKHSRRPFGGLWRDLQNLASRYPSDFKDALKPQVFISIIFIYISFLAPAIAFGGLMEEFTGNIIGETETLLSTALGGIIFSTFAVQPLTVLAFTGPVIVFESIIFRFSQNFDLPYIQWRAVIGLWLMLILLVLAISELTFLVHHFTRFSEEIFTGIIAVFFIYEAILSIYHIYDRNPLCGLHYPCGSHTKYSNTCTASHYDKHNETSYYNETSNDSEMMTATSMKTVEEAMTLPRGFRICNQPNTFLWSLMLSLLTFYIAFSLRKLRFKKFLGKKTRRLVSDFGMLTALGSMVLLAYLFRDIVAIEVLLVPPKYSVSNPEARGWFINPLDGSLSIVAGFGAMIPALLLAILIFVENQLAIIAINNPDHKLKKPVGYHLDLTIVALLSGVCGMIGIPFLCGAPVRSIQHLQALSVFTKKDAPGEKPKLVKIHEQRVTGIVVNCLILLTPFASEILELIPISVVMGVFFYLGYASLSGVQLLTRIKLLFMLPKHHPDVSFIRKVRTWKMHLYTLIQLGCVFVLYGIKLSPAAMLYPLMIVFLIPLRWLLGKVLYTKDEIEALDNEENAKLDEDDKGELGEFEYTHVPY